MNWNTHRLRWLLLMLGMVALGATLARGDELTRQIQEELRKRHLYFGDVDGRFTPELGGALARYQERKGFAANGQPDDETLRSLNLRPPPPRPPPGEPPPGLAAAPGVESRAREWPDVAVLRSDQSREEKAGAPPAETFPRFSEMPSPPMASPGPAVDASPASPPTPDQVRDFLERYLNAGQANDPAKELEFYGPQVNYFEDGVVDHAYIDQDIRRYERRWPQRRFALEGPVQVKSALAAGGDARMLVHFRYRFSVSGGHYTVSGETQNDYTLLGNPSGDLRIIGLKEERVRPPDSR